MLQGHYEESEENLQKIKLYAHHIYIYKIAPIHNIYRTPVTNIAATQFTNGQRTFCKESIVIVNKHKDRYSPSLVIKETQVETTLRADRVHNACHPRGLRQEELELKGSLCCS